MTYKETTYLKSTEIKSPSNLIDAWGLVQRNWVIVPSIFITFSLSNAAVEW